jgi:hypothetical protein
VKTLYTSLFNKLFDLFKLHTWLVTLTSLDSLVVLPSPNKLELLGFSPLLELPESLDPSGLVGFT